MPKEQRELLNRILARRGSDTPVVCLHSLDQDLVTAMAKIILSLALKLDENNIEF